MRHTADRVSQHQISSSYHCDCVVIRQSKSTLGETLSIDNIVQRVSSSRKRQFLSTMSEQQDDKFAFVDPSSTIVKTEKKEWRSQAFQGVSPFDFAMKQKLEAQERKDRERNAKSAMWKYKSQDQGLEAAQRKEQYDREKKEKELRTQTKQNLKDVQASQTKEEAERAAQFEREKKDKSTRTDTKSNLKDVFVSDTAETLSRKEQWDREVNSKASARDTMSKLKDINISETTESMVRKEQWQRDQGWKQTSREQAKKNADFDMAKSLFGSGGAAPSTEEDEEQ